MVHWHGQSTCKEAGHRQWAAIQAYTASAASSVNMDHLPASEGEQALGLCLLLGKGRVKRTATCTGWRPVTCMGQICPTYPPHPALPCWRRISDISAMCWLPEQTSPWREHPPLKLKTDASQLHSCRTDDSGHANESCSCFVKLWQMHWVIAWASWYWYASQKRAAGLAKQGGQIQLRQHGEQFLFSTRGWTDGLERGKSTSLNTLL